MIKMKQTQDSKPIALEIDHVTIAGRNLQAMERSFANLGLTTDYGGPHASITHMALLGFDDGSYVELISSQDPVEKSSQLATHAWARFISADGGPCAWAVGVDDVADECIRVSALGIQVTGPLQGRRQKPDGELVEWDSAVLGPGAPGATLPFIIKDRTARSLRVRPSASVIGTDAQGQPRPDRLTGVAEVVLGVEDFDEAVRIFCRVYNWPAPRVEDD